MTVRELVPAARTGDQEAFTHLVEKHSAMAFGFALAMLGDYQLAEDATQEAFVAAFFGLAGLRDSAAFPGWLRGIVRNQCLRILRERKGTQLPLDVALSVADGTPGPDESAAQAEARETVLDAVMQLSPEQREVVTLYYIGDYSQREVAAFLEVPISRVNNRLHAARQKLKGGLIEMVRDDLKGHAPGDDFSQRVGRVIATHGPVVDADFGDGQVPAPLDGVAAGDAASLAVVERLEGGLVRCITLDAGNRIEPGTTLRETGQMVERPISVDVLREALGVMLQGHQRGNRVIETGIKVIDLLSPIPSAGVVGLYGPQGAGKIVVLGELIHRLRAGGQPLTLLNFTQADTIATISVDEPLPVGGDSLEALYLPVRDAASPASTAVEEARTMMHAAIYLSHELALEALYPAIDPLVTWSSLLHAEFVSREHLEIAEEVRGVLTSAPKSSRARRLRLFFTQPFFTTEEYTRLSGEYVPLAATLEGCRKILAGSLDGMPEEAFRFTGTLDQVLARANEETS